MELALMRRTGRSMTSLRDLIAQHAVISFAAIDALLAYRTFGPAGVFAILEERHGAGGFAGARIKAEWLAKRRFGAGEGAVVSLDEIYQILGELLPGTRITPDMERDALQGLLTADPAVLHLVSLAQQAGKRVLALSDGALDDAALRGLLAGAGIEVDGLICAVDHRAAGLRKSNGGLFRHAAAAEGVQPNELLHFGPDPRVDVAGARAAGVTGAEIRTARACLADVPQPFLPTVAEGVAGSLIAGQVALAMPGLGADGTPLRSLGYAIGGPLLAGFCLSVLDRARREGRADLVLLAPGGDLVDQALQALAPHGVGWSVMPMSERMAVVPMLGEDPALAEEGLFARLPEQDTPRAYWSRLGFDRACLDGHAEAEQAVPLRQFLQDFGPVLRRCADAERRALEVHLQGWLGTAATPLLVGGIGDDTVLAVIDRLTEGVRPCSLACVLSPGRAETKGFLFEAGAGDDTALQLARAADLIEVLFAEPAPEWGRVALREDRTVPERLPDASLTPLRRTAIAEIRQGALDFVADIRWAQADLDPMALREHVRAALVRLLLDPKPAEIAALRSVPARGAAGRMLADALDTTAARSAGHAADVDLLRQNRVLRDLLPRDLARQAEAGELSGQDWRAAFWSNPLKVERWSALKRFQKRVAKRAAAAEREK
jgi:FMN phosphatase YigB (HAD superfamily)